MGFFDTGSQTVRGNENLTLPKFLELRDLSESIFGFFLRHFKIRKPEKCGGVGSIIQVLVVVLDDRGALSMFVELTVARRARSARALRSAPGSPEQRREIHAGISQTFLISIRSITLRL